MTSNRYFVYGLRVTSELELPELEHTSAPAIAGVAEVPHVSVSVADVPAYPDDPDNRWFFVRPDGTAVLSVTGTARYAIRSGDSITVQPEGDADPATVRLFLLGSAFGTLLHQRGDLPLHVGAVEVGGRAVAFTAPSGTGKSTLVAGLNLLADLPFVSDDVAVLRADAGAAPGSPDGAEDQVPGTLWPGPPIMKLMPDAIDGLDASQLDMAPEYAHSPKQRIRVAHRSQRTPLPLSALIVLERTSDPSAPALTLDPLDGSDAFVGAQTAVYRFEMGVAVASLPELFRRTAWLACTVPIYRGHVGIQQCHDRHRWTRAVVKVAQTVMEISATQNQSPEAPSRRPAHNLF